MTLTKFISTLLGDIRFWILLFLVIRLINIDAPPLDSHNWRQADGYSIARNFLEIDANPLYPRIDHAGDLSGIMGSEFPIMNYLVYLLYKVFGIDWWQGRLLNLLTSSMGCWFFYKIIRFYIKPEIAFTATMFLLSSIWFAHSRKFMPDVFSVSLVITGIYFAYRYLQDKRGVINLVLFGVFCSIGLLSKLPAFVVTALLVPAMFDKNVDLRRKAYTVLVTAILLIPVCAWYFYWVPLLTSTYGHFYFYMGSSLSDSLQALTSNWENTIHRFTYDAMHYVGFTLYAIGVVLVIKHQNRKLMIALISAFGLQLLYMLIGGETFANHSYYIVPFVPAIALFAAYTLSFVKKKWIKNGLIILVVAEGIGNQQHDFRISSNGTYKLRLESIADKYSDPKDLVAINNHQNPASLYFAHRRGWSTHSSDSSKSEIFQSLRDHGCKLIIWDKHIATTPTTISYFEKVEEDIDFAIFLPSNMSQ